MPWWGLGLLFIGFLILMVLVVFAIVGMTTYIYEL